MYINGTGAISPQQTAVGAAFWPAVQDYTTNRLKVVDPDYKQWIDLKQIRRMSRVIKMGVGAAQLSLQQAGISVPDGIITGTAYGCLDDTGVFLQKMVVQEEQMLTPTAFIQSTHNTVGGQIALLLGCHAYNNTFVHRGFSFESALLDAIMFLREGEARQLLVGGLDEITHFSHAILQRFGLYKTNPGHSGSLLQLHNKGTIAGEGAAFFVLGAASTPHTKACLAGVQTIYKPTDNAAIQQATTLFLAAHGLLAADIDLLITGRNGDVDDDQWYNTWTTAHFPGKPEAAFKHLCGEYPTATGFGMWLGANVLAHQQVPAEAMYSGTVPAKINNILMYNHHLTTHHSLILMQVC
ncbi:beta-ketoacyl synthase [Chitinophaga costaii]|nr:beta-ketoacyl synthase [Chitinophaga costaii]